MNLSVVIPTYKNRKILIKNLKHNLAFLRGCEIIVVNDDPKESLKNEELGNNVIIVENDNNLGFGQTMNIGVKKAKGNYVLFLNDDVVLNNDSFQRSLSRFKKEKKLFAVSFAQREKDESLVGKNSIYWKNGMMFHRKAPDSKNGINAWAEGGACVVDKRKFLELVGFDPLYSPFYWEDLDLSYRAWKLGYKIYFDSTVIVQHHHESTIGKYFSKSFVRSRVYRNQFTFIWKNITDLKLLIEHVVYLPYNLLYYGLIKRDFNFLGGFFSALLRLRRIVDSRKKISKVLSDQEILHYFYE